MARSKVQHRPLLPHEILWVLAALVFISGCALAPLAAQFGADLISSASSNYSQQYAKQLEGLLVAVYHDKTAKKTQEQTTVAQAGPYGASDPYPAQSGAYPAAQSAPYGASPASSDPYPQGGGAYPSSGAGAYGAAPGQPAGSPYSSDPYPAQSAGANPSGAYGQSAYPSGSSIVLDAAILAQRASDRAARRADPVPLQDGETLRDGGSDPRKGDVVKFSFRVNCDCYVYVIGADATGYIARIFPDAGSGMTNPVHGNQQYLVPGGTAWYGLDQYKGVEQVFFIVSRGPRKDIENPLNQLTQTARSSLTKNFRAVREAVQPGATRGLVKVQMGTPSTVQAESGQRVSFTPQSFAAQPGSDDVVVTRWFNHE